MNKITKKMFTAILSVTFSLVALGTVTFAWFTLTNITTIDSFDIDVSTTEGIEVAFGDKDEWFTEINNETMTGYLRETALKNFKGLKPVTSPDGVYFYTREDRNQENPLSDPVLAGYVEFKLRFRSLIANTAIYLSPETVMSDPEGITWTSDASFTNSKGKEIKVGEKVTFYVANAARMSFDDGDDGAGNLFVYELPDNSYGDELDEKFGNYSHSDNPLEDSDNPLEEGKITPIANGAISYYNRKHSLNQLKDYKDIKLAQANTSFLGANQIAVTSNNTLTDGYYETSITVRIWLEGWDADCMDPIVSGANDNLVKKLRIRLQFTSNKPIGYKDQVWVEEIENGNEPRHLIVRSKEVFASVGTEVTSSLTLPDRYIEGLEDLYTYNSDKETGSVTDDNKLIVAKIYDRKEFTVTFDSNGGVLNPEDQTAMAFKWGQNPTKLPIPKREGYRFMGWYLDIDENDPFDSMPQKNVTVYAKWEPLYRISFYDGSSLVGLLDYIEKEEVTAPDIPTKEGHTFAGWYEDPEFTEELLFPFDMPARNVVVYVKWNVNQYSITFDTDEGNQIDDKVFDFGYDLSGYELPTPVKEGYKFIGWFADADYTESFELPETMPADNITLYAKWESIED